VQSDGGFAPSAGDAESQAALGIQQLGIEATVKGGADRGVRFSLVGEKGRAARDSLRRHSGLSHSGTSIAGGGAKGSGRLVFHLAIKSRTGG
jgi:hypothetical protein